MCTYVYAYMRVDVHDGFKILCVNVYPKTRLQEKLPEHFRKMRLPGKPPENFRKKATQIHNFRYALPNVYVRFF